MQLLGLVLVLVSLVILFLQNRTPAIALHFLGLQTVALPLAVWVVSAAIFGLFVGWLIAGLLQMTFVFYKPRFNLGRRANPSEESQAGRNGSVGNNWVDEEEEDADAASRNRSYEAPQSPRVSLQDGSRYSYSYRSSKQKQDADLPESDDLDDSEELDTPDLEQPVSPISNKTVDAEYRVLVPPSVDSGVRYRETGLDNADEDWEEEPVANDWDFDDRSRAPRRDRW